MFNNWRSSHKNLISYLSWQNWNSSCAGLYSHLATLAAATKDCPLQTWPHALSCYRPCGLASGSLLLPAQHPPRRCQGATPCMNISHACTTGHKFWDRKMPVTFSESHRVAVPDLNRTLASNANSAKPWRGCSPERVAALRENPCPRDQTPLALEDDCPLEGHSSLGSTR